MAKILIGSELGSYSFNKTAKTITFTGFTATLERLLLITDVTNNTIIYNFADPTLGGTLSNNVLTLTYNTNTGSFANTDNLQIFYWSEQPQQTDLMNIAMSIKRDLQMIRRDPFQTAGTGLPVQITSGTITVSAVTALNSLGSGAELVPGQLLNQTIMRNNFNNWKSNLIS